MTFIRRNIQQIDNPSVSSQTCQICECSPSQGCVMVSVASDHLTSLVTWSLWPPYVPLSVYILTSPVRLMGPGVINLFHSYDTNLDKAMETTAFRAAPALARVGHRSTVSHSVSATVKHLCCSPDVRSLR